VLVVNDEPTSGKALQGALALEGFDVVLATDHGEALDVVECTTPDAVIIDVRSPYGRAAALCRHVRETWLRISVLMLGPGKAAAPSGRLVEDADDYIAKPFVLVELLARLRPLLRRKGRAGADVRRFDDLVLDPAAHEVVRAGRSIELTLTSSACSSSS
jgi:DNA-binding response OmpR family regulator